MTNFKRGDVVGVNHPQQRGLDCVIQNIRHIQRGRRAGMVEYTLAPIGKANGKAYAFKTVGTSHLKKPHRKHTQAEIKAALGEAETTRANIEQRKYERASRGCDALLDNNIQPGDEVLVKYTDTQRWEVVGKLNYNTGKVAILKHNIVEILAAKRKRQANELDRILDSMGLGAHKKRGRQPYRWIHMDHVIDVRKTKED
jgi:hypothetical protein